VNNDAVFSGRLVWERLVPGMKFGPVFGSCFGSRAQRTNGNSHLLAEGANINVEA
jgi:hypothetical protein